MECVLPEFEDNELCSPEEIEEYLRLDSAFRIVCAAYALMVTSLSQTTKLPNRESALVLNLSADLQLKAHKLMLQSPSLKRQAEAHLKLLRREVGT